MNSERRECVSKILISILVLAALAGSSGAEEVVIPSEVFFYMPVASVFGPSSIWNNPAALANPQLGTLLVLSTGGNRVVRDWGGAGTMKMLAAAYRKVNYGDRPDLQEYIFALGGGQRYKFGLSYRYFKEGPGYLNNRHLWNLAIVIQQNEKFSLGARADNLNRGRIDGVRSDIRFVYGAASRVYRDMVTLSFDVDMTQKESINQADFRTGVEVRPMPGMYLYANFDNHSRFNLGFRLNFGSSYVGHYHNFDRDAKSRRSDTYVGSVNGKQPSLTTPKHKALMVHLDGALPENRRMPVWGKKPLKYFDYIDGIYRAADDDEIDRMFLDIGELKCGLGKVEELSEAAKYFRSRGKKVYAYIGTPNNLGYLLASAADTVILPPVSQLNLIGLHANLMSLKGLMDKIGVEAEIERIDEYKTAPEPLMFDRPTEPHREQINRILDNLYSDMVNTVAANRNLGSDSVMLLIDQAPLASVDAVDCGLVDEVAYLDDAVKKYAGSDLPFISRQISLPSYVQREVYNDRWGEPAYMALVVADGSISSGKSGGRMGDYEMLDALRRVRGDHRIKGVVLRINSPGGSAIASDLIWHEVERMAEKKPVVISMGNVAASGGYYISSIDGEIFVNRNTLTGSIGVFGGKANISELLDKIDVYTETYVRGRNAGIYSPYQPFTDDQRRQLRDQMQRFYTHFTEKVGAVREMTADSVNALGRGQVWTGTEAVANGLADRIGGIHRALETLYAKCGIEPDEAAVVFIPQEHYLLRNPFDVPLIYEKLAAWLSGAEEGLASNFMESDHVFYRMPYNIEIE